MRRIIEVLRQKKRGRHAGIRGGGTQPQRFRANSAAGGAPVGCLMARTNLEGPHRLLFTVEPCGAEPHWR